MGEQQLREDFEFGWLVLTHYIYSICVTGNLPTTRALGVAALEVGLEFCGVTCDLDSLCSEWVGV